MDARPNGLLAWQWSLYPDGHRDRRNLILHILTVPLFLGGTLAIVSGLATGLWWSAVSGLGTMVIAVAAQGRGHKLETTRPVPFRGPLDIVARLIVEQWVTFPRFVLSGGFARAWRAADLKQLKN